MEPFLWCRYRIRYLLCQLSAYCTAAIPYKFWWQYFRLILSSHTCLFTAATHFYVTAALVVGMSIFTLHRTQWRKIYRELIRSIVHKAHNISLVFVPCWMITPRKTKNRFATWKHPIQHTLQWRLVDNYKNRWWFRAMPWENYHSFAGQISKTSRLCSHNLCVECLWGNMCVL